MYTLSVLLWEETEQIIGYSELSYCMIHNVQSPARSAEIWRKEVQKTRVAGYIKIMQMYKTCANFTPVSSLTLNILNYSAEFITM